MSIEARLRTALTEIKSAGFEPMTQLMPNRLSGWQSAIGDLPAWNETVEVIRGANLVVGDEFSITRQQMLDWVAAGLPLRIRLLLSLLWGYGAGKGRGRDAVSKIMRSPQLDSIVSAAGMSLEEGNVEGTFKSLAKIKKLGISFISKFLYFETRAADPAATRCCLIFDNRVSKNLVRLAVEAEDRWVCDAIDFVRGSSWRAYNIYWQNIRTLAVALDIAPDRLELWLYRTADQPVIEPPR
jgi:hypothetical protein